MIQALRIYYRFLLCGLAILSISRLGLVALSWERVQATDGLGHILLQGVRFDLVLLGLLLVIPSLLGPWFLIFRRSAAATMKVLGGYFTLALVWVLFMEIATPSFLNEYDTRPNYLFVEYLKYPKEVFATLWGAYRLPLILAAVAVPLFALLVHRRVFRPLQLERPLGPLGALALLLLLAVGCFAAIRSTTDHRPVNPSTVVFCSDAMVNTLPLPSGYTLLYALYESRLEDQGGVHYGKMDLERVVQIVRETSGIPAAAFDHPELRTLHRHQATRTPQRPLNLVIVLEESLGAEFVGSMGGPPITPELDALAAQGIWMEQLYATGTRSVRGIEAVITGFPPTTARSVVKLPRSQRDFFTIAQLLQEQGYRTSFHYGGSATFDNMGRFFTGNGFETLVDQNDYLDPVFVGSWGASDEDLFHAAHDAFEAMGDQPFFSLVFTSSNHTPFQFPDGRIELYEQPQDTVHNAVKYADWALGDFFRLARRSNYWDNTVFLVVADHNSRVKGASLVPIQRFHIPGVFLGATIKPQRISEVTSQLDLLPTALSLIGVSGSIPCLGRDLTVPLVPGAPGRAVMQYHNVQAYRENERVIIMRPQQEMAQFRWDGAQLLPAAQLDPALAERALAHALWPQWAYANSNYALPSPTSAN